MFGELFHKSPLLLYPLVALAIFILVFAGVVVRAMRQRPEERDALARLPLGENDDE